VGELNVLDDELARLHSDIEFKAPKSMECRYSTEDPKSRSALK